MHASRWSLVVSAIGVAIGSLILQLCAYDSSWLTAQHPRHCLVWGFGACESIMASGYASIVPGQSINFEAVIARFVPLAMWLALAVAILRTNKWIVFGAAGLVLLVSAPAFRRRPAPEPVAAHVVVPADRDRTLGAPCKEESDCGHLGCKPFAASGHLVLRGTAGATLRCSRACESGCPAGFRCTFTMVPLSGGNPVRLDACGPEQ